MAATSLAMIKRAMRLSTVLGVDETPSAAESQDGLSALNSMLEAWSIERLMVYAIQQTTHSWTANEASRTIGVGGNFNTTRPYQVQEEGNFFRSSDIDYPLTVLGDRDSYDRILMKSSSSSYPLWLFPLPSYPLMILYVWPVPTQTLELHLNSLTPLQVFDSLTEEIALPPGYQRAIEFNLAVEIASEYGVAAPASVQKIAANAKAAIKGVNRPDLVARLDNGLSGSGAPYNIYTDGVAVAN